MQPTVRPDFMRLAAGVETSRDRIGVALLAGKLSFPAIDAKLRGRAAGSRVAGSDERSELALDAGERPRNGRNRIWPHRSLAHAGTGVTD